MKSETKKIIQELDEQYKSEVKKEIGLNYAGEVSDTARLYRLIPKYNALENKVNEAINAIKEVQLFAKVNHVDPKAYQDAVKDFVEKYKEDFK